MRSRASSGERVGVSERGWSGWRSRFEGCASLSENRVSMMGIGAISLLPVHLQAGASQVWTRRQPDGMDVGVGLRELRQCNRRIPADISNCERVMEWRDFPEDSQECAIAFANSVLEAGGGWSPATALLTMTQRPSNGNFEPHPLLA